eukprot:TRINITY_DN15620_c0_g1_i1.p1 TRINITY_DN15620_c0_g1~~TRINITY_DN15620_c0_g1_i1.p1  ORF type:complete len:153 (-),score=32.51 TRINITY_DN15620_c0_g1_i1:38-496(-)
MAFRTHFTFEGLVNWFPGHMAKSYQKMRDFVKNVDLVIEVRDARIPFSSANPLLETLTSNTSEKRGNSPYNEEYERIDEVGPNEEHLKKEKPFNMTGKKRIIVFNKADLGNHHLQARVTQYYSSRNQPTTYIMANGSESESRDPTNIIKMAV